MSGCVSNAASACCKPNALYDRKEQLGLETLDPDGSSQDWDSNHKAVI